MKFLPNQSAVLEFKIQADIFVINLIAMWCDIVLVKDELQVTSHKPGAEHKNENKDPNSHIPLCRGSHFSTLTHTLKQSLDTFSTALGTWNHQHRCIKRAGEKNRGTLALSFSSCGAKTWGKALFHHENGSACHHLIHVRRNPDDRRWHTSWRKISCFCVICNFKYMSSRKRKRDEKETLADET